MATIILPTQLFPEPLQDGRQYLVEHPRYFTDFDFHKQKLVLHRASMQTYYEEHGGEYVRFDEDLATVFEGEDSIRLYEPVDHKLRNQLEALADTHDVTISFEETPAFMASRAFNSSYFQDNDYFQLAYYKQMRQRFDVLVESDGTPTGGSFHVQEAKQYVQEHFQDNPGSMETFDWPVTREQALTNLEHFLEHRLESFGDYQDAIDPGIDHGFHSLLSPGLNIGLLT
ncbi:MAG: cryptochrome/photolyase family protein, partial [Candidatus Nanohaloarchaea archaeon]|nr:cryptochrome/photolyase family protein [Candidatus Nanohaloarchaea archaeon]